MKQLVVLLAAGAIAAGVASGAPEASRLASPG